jgi:hypothetical protein
MRRSASEVINDLEQRVARLERQATTKTASEMGYALLFVEDLIQFDWDDIRNVQVHGVGTDSEGIVDGKRHAHIWANKEDATDAFLSLRWSGAVRKFNKGHRLAKMFNLTFLKGVDDGDDQPHHIVLAYGDVDDLEAAINHLPRLHYVVHYHVDGKDEIISV